METMETLRQQLAAAKAELAAVNARADRELARAEREARAFRLHRQLVLSAGALPRLSERETRSSSRSAELLEHLTLLPSGSGVDGALPGFPAVEGEEELCRAVLQRMRGVPRPAAVAREVQELHPFLQMLLSAIEAELQQRGLPALKGHPEAKVGTHGGRPDLSFTLRNEQRALNANMCTLLEAKPGSRVRTSEFVLAREGVAQAIRYLAGRQMDCDDVPTRGVACVCVGAATLWVVHIDYSAPSAPVTLSEELPLLPAALDAAEGAAVAVDALAAPAGLRALVRLLASTDLSLFGLRALALPLDLDGGWENRGLLGSGGFSEVARLAREGVEVAGKFARAPKNEEYVLTEKDVLLELAARGVLHVPRVHVHDGDAAPFLRAGGRSVLLMTPVGMPLSVAFGAVAQRARLAARLLSDVGEALAGAHAAGIVHCDVRPSNVVAVACDGDGGDNFYSFVLIDWGLAVRAAAPAPSGRKLRGERGFMSARLLRAAAAPPPPPPQPSLAVTVDDDLEAAVWTFCAAVEGAVARAPWAASLGDYATALDVLRSRGEWVRERVASLRAAAEGLPEGLRARVRAVLDEASGYGVPA